MSANTPPSEKRTDYAALSSLQRDILWTLLHTNTPKGITVRERLERDYGHTAESATVYVNLNELVEAGYVEKTLIDGRTNGYRLRDAGRRLLSHRRQLEHEALEGAR